MNISWNFWKLRVAEIAVLEFAPGGNLVYAVISYSYLFCQNKCYKNLTWFQSPKKDLQNMNRLWKEKKVDWKMHWVRNLYQWGIEIFLMFLNDLRIHWREGGWICRYFMGKQFHLQVLQVHSIISAPKRFRLICCQPCSFCYIGYWQCKIV